ncbi:hypothetical protein [Roseibium polysiphoniae]|uniref:SnoaL-like domain-containing protein n=1 Tax=Roseibium polysiphoniae TaxID=2571221 RepID=A0ABR9C8F9_9HYPH|nr:hypothetical protein [Roseibium polysiphoniae]MBD8876180.1 hypothetical protein [Roseibium polysiphoniae]
MSVGIVQQVLHVNTLCKELDENKIFLKAIEHYLDTGGAGTVAIPGQDGTYENYPKVHASSAEEYLEKYPDCCRYYPVEVDGKPLSVLSRFLERQCGFVGIDVHIRYLKDGQIKTDFPVFSRVRVIDTSYQIFSYSKDQ